MTSVVCKPLRELLLEGVSRQYIQESLDDFACVRNEDVTRFLRSYAIENEANGATRSYLVLELEALKTGALRLVAFYSLAMTVTDFEGVSNRKRRRIMGNVPRVGKSRFFPGFLIAQLARSDFYSHQDLDCVALLRLAEETVETASEAIGGRLIYLDCKDALVPYYEGQGYTQLFYDKARHLHKMFKCIPAISYAA